MLGRHYLVGDTFCELFSQLEPFIDQSFWNFDQHEPVANSVIVISRQTLNQHWQKIKSLAESDFCLPVLANPTEGSETMKLQCKSLGLLDVLRRKKMLLVGCGDMESDLPNLWYDIYCCKPLDYEENIQACQHAGEIFTKLKKPYDFLFLNGRSRAHRKYLLERLKDQGLLERSLWTNLDTSPVPAHSNVYGALCERISDVRCLPAQYEVKRYSAGLKAHYKNKFVKDELFLNEWGEIYLSADAYIDTYFSLVTETVFDYPYSLRSEKIYKPIAIGHPFVAAANRGFYRDLHKAGFRTFGHLIDESFDQIDNGQQRLERIVSVVQDLVAQDLASFLVAAQDICVYNQQHMRELAPQIRQEFVGRFHAFLDQHT